MPTVSRWSIRAAALSFIAGMLLWSAAALLPALGHARISGAIGIPAFHLIVVGGLTQMVFGVAWWMFPVRNKNRGRGNPAFAWAAFVALNVGSWARLAGSIASSFGSAPLATGALLTAAITLPLAAILFGAMIFGRLRGPAQREAGT